jgi:hypothetical protein
MPREVGFILTEVEEEVTEARLWAGTILVRGGQGQEKRSKEQVTNPIWRNQIRALRSLVIRHSCVEEPIKQTASTDGPEEMTTVLLSNCRGPLGSLESQEPKEKG